MFSRAIRFLLIIASFTVVAFVALSAGNFTSMFPHDLNILEKITSIVTPKEIVEVEVEEVEETFEAEQSEVTVDSLKTLEAPEVQ